MMNITMPAPFAWFSYRPPDGEQGFKIEPNMYIFISLFMPVSTVRDEHLQPRH